MQQCKGGFGHLRGALPAATADGLVVDVVVVGGGNAGLCAALSAREMGASVLLLEAAPKEWRGGNSKYTRNVRCVAEGGGYGEDKFMDDLVRVTGEGMDVALAQMVIRESRDLPAWMEGQGVRWQPALNGTLQLSVTNRFFLGGGKALVNQYFRRAEELGIDIQYESPAAELEMTAGRFQAVTVQGTSGRSRIEARTIVVAAGGFESNIAWLKRYWGEAAGNYIIRGTRYNNGALLEELLRMGARPAGPERGFHAISVDARSPRYDGGIVTRVDSVPFGIVVNAAGERFADEGQDLWPKRYASWGTLIANQPGQAAYSIFDSKAWGKFIPPLYEPVAASTIEQLATALGVAPRLADTVKAFNESAPAGHAYDMSQLDRRSTTGLTPAKSNWAVTIDHPPFYGFPLRPGITFTYLGVAVDDHARVLTSADDHLAGVFAAGEIVAGNILQRGYLAGFGMTIGSVFGRIAGREAAMLSRRSRVAR